MSQAQNLSNSEAISQAAIIIGILIHAGIVMATVIGAFWKLKSDVKSEIDALKLEFTKELRTVSERLAVVETKLDGKEVKP